MDRRRGVLFTGIAALALAVSACLCTGAIPVPGVGNLGDVQQTVDAAATEMVGAMPTLEAAMTEAAANLPTLQAAATELFPTLEAGATQFGGFIPDAPAYGEEDGLLTEVLTLMFVPETRTGYFSAAGVAHNYLFAGTPGQSITVRVQGDGLAEIRIYDTAGVLSSSTIATGTDTSLTFSVPDTPGLYTARLAGSAAGNYTISISG